MSLTDKPAPTPAPSERCAKCSNKDNDGCDAPAVARYTWPGRDEAFACVYHALKIQAVATAIGLHLQMVHLSRDGSDIRAADEEASR